MRRNYFRYLLTITCLDGKLELIRTQVYGVFWLIAKLVTQYIPYDHKIHAPKNQNIKRTSRLKNKPRRYRWQSTATTPYNGTGNQIQIAKMRSTPDAKPSMLPNTRTNYRPFRDKSRRRANTQKRLSDLFQFPSISVMSNSISLIISSFWPPNYIEEKAVTATRGKTFQVSEDNTS